MFIAVRGRIATALFPRCGLRHLPLPVVTLYLHPEANFAPLKYLASFRTTLKVSRYLFRALALLIWLLIAFVSVFYIVNALPSGNLKFVEFNLSSDQAQPHPALASDV